MTTMIERNTTIPSRRSETFSTAQDNQPAVEVHVLQGEREFANDNTSLGRFHLMGIPPAPRGLPQIEVTFDIDANGIVDVSAKDLGTGTEQSIKIEGQTSLSEDEIKQKISDAEEFAEEDKRRKMKVELRNTADSIVYQTRRTIDDTKDKLTDEVVNPVLEKLKELESMIINDDVPVSDENLDEEGIQSRIQELEELMHKLSSKLYEAASAEMSEEEGTEDQEGNVVEADFEVLDSDEDEE